MIIILFLILVLLLEIRSRKKLKDVTHALELRNEILAHEADCWRAMCKKNTVTVGVQVRLPVPLADLCEKNEECMSDVCNVATRALSNKIAECLAPELECIIRANYSRLKSCSVHTCGLLDLRIPLVRADIESIEVYYCDPVSRTSTPLRSRHQIEMEYLGRTYSLNKDLEKQMPTLEQTISALKNKCFHGVNLE